MSFDKSQTNAFLKYKRLNGHTKFTMKTKKWAKSRKNSWKTIQNKYDENDGINIIKRNHMNIYATECQFTLKQEIQLLKLLCYLLNDLLVILEEFVPTPQSNGH